MGYTKRWVPPVIPVRNNLAVWKELFLDVHNNLIEAGLVQTEDAGQLDISAVASLPSMGSFAGYRMYRFDDGLQDESPIFIKIEFGVGPEGLRSTPSQRKSDAPNLRVTVGNSTDGAGQVVGEYARHFHCPQEYSLTNGGGSDDNETNGLSYCCRNDDIGFFGFVYGAGSRNNPPQHSSSADLLATLVFFIQRSIGEDGIPSADGFALMSPQLTSGGNNHNIASNPAGCQYVSKDYVQPWDGNARLMAVRFGGNSNSVHGENVVLQPVFMNTPRLIQWPSLATYNVGNITEAVEFTLEAVPGSPMNFIAIGNGVGMPVDTSVGVNAAFAMLFE